MFLRIVVVTCVLCLGVLTVLVACDVVVPGDAELVQLVVSTRSEGLTVAIQLLTFISSSIPALLITLAVSGAELWRAKRLTFAAGWATMAYLSNVACNIALRIAVGRFRPGVACIPHVLPEIQVAFQRFSYPSGHAGAALLAYSSLVALVWPCAAWRWPVLALALLVVVGTSFGRVYLGVHWPTDVLGGLLLAGAWLGAGFALKNQIVSVRTPRGVYADGQHP